MNLNAALNNNRLMKGVTGMSIKEFKKLAEDFQRELENEGELRYRTGLKTGKRKRKPGGGRGGRLKTAYEKLFLILFYLKCYPAFDLLGLIFVYPRERSIP